MKEQYAYQFTMLQKKTERPVSARNRFFWLISIFCMLWINISLISPMRAEASGYFAGMEEITIVIDPGHGGENEGTTENGFCEKEMTLITALAIQEELSQYENLHVYLTRTDDVDIDLEERVQYAKDAGADFLFCVHYNASENHELFGSEVWIPLEAPFNLYGYQFGYIQLEKMREMGLFIRGIKTRENGRGQNYYGILRHAVEMDIPAVLIEHCHVDEARDSVFCDTDEKLRALGRADAEAIAEFLGLKPMENVPDCYSYKPSRVMTSTYLDSTCPDVAVIETKEALYDQCRLSLSVEAADYDSPLMYYTYSLDGGVTYSERYPWPDCDTLTGTYNDSPTITLDIPDGILPRVILRAYNQFEQYSESNQLTEFDVFKRPEPTAEPTAQPTAEPEMEESLEAAAMPEGTPDPGDVILGQGTFLRQQDTQSTPSPVQRNLMIFLGMSIIAAVVLLCLVLLAQAISNGKRRRHRRNRRNKGV